VYWQKELGAFVQDDFRVRPNLSLSIGLRYNWQNYLHDSNNFAPRFAFAYSAGKKRKTVFRGGAGIFYDRTGAGPARLPGCGAIALLQPPGAMA
jgi:outer membrane receptor protein involved in Fe transport